MLDFELKEQLKSVFSSLENKISLVYFDNGHAEQADLLQMLQDVVDCNPDKLILKKSQLYPAQNQSPEFYLEKQELPLGVIFKGIPNGHEFTSLVVAILNADGKGKMPDPLLQERIRNLNGPIRVRTYISLTCENCPEVVQAFNQMALIHADFKHEMVDGVYFQNTLSDLGIQGVPSVVINNQMIHSGRSNMMDLLSKLEGVYGKSETNISEQQRDLGFYDVVVVGGGPAGVSAAIYSVRKGLKTALIADKIGGQVQETRGIENLISVIYTEGPKLAASLNQHLNHYPVKIFESRRVKSIEKPDSDKTTGSRSHHTLNLESGEFIKANQLIIASGAKWRELKVPGEKEYLGRGVAFCPHCDGPFYKNKSVAVIGGGNSGVEAAIDLAGIVKDVILVEFNDRLKADQILVDKLNSLNNVKIVTSSKTEKILGDGQKVTSFEILDRKTNTIKSIDIDGVFVQIGLLPNSEFAKEVLELTPFGEIKVNEKGQTSVKGIYAAGDVTTTPYKQIIISMGEGAKAALAAFEDRMREI